MATRKPAGRTRARRSTKGAARASTRKSKATKGKVKTETTVGSRVHAASQWEGLDGSAIWPRSAATSPKAKPASKTKAKPTPEPKVEAQPVSIPTPTPPAPPPGPAFGPEDWVVVRYEGQSMFSHPQAGLFVYGTTTTLRGEVAQTLAGVDGFVVQKA
jgi:hypothetical protein